MSSYRAGGAWDGGPPGAEADYATQHPPAPPQYPAPPPPRAMPTTDPWTGVSYSQYGPPPNYDYQAYGAAGYSYNYDSSYYQRPDGTYFNKYPDTSSAYPPPQTSYNYPSQPREQTRSPVDTRSYDRHRKTYSRSASPYDKREREYSRKRESSYEDNRRGRSGSRSMKSKRSKYSSDVSRSRSRSYSRSSRKEKMVRRSLSSGSSGSDRSYKRRHGKGRARDSLTPPLKKKSSRKQSKSHRTPSPQRSNSRSPKIKVERDVSKGKDKPTSSKDTKNKDHKKHREVATPPPKRRAEVSMTPPKHKKDRSIMPSKSYKKAEHTVTPPKGKFKESKSAKSKHRDSSVTPPKSYARSRSPSSSKSRSRSPTPRHTKRKLSKSRSCSRSSSRSSFRSRSKSMRKQKSDSKDRSRTRSRSRRRSVSESRSTTRRQSKSRVNKRSVSPEPSKPRSESKSRSGSGTPSEDERRGQFTVADRKRFWKKHRNRIEEKEKGKTPPKEVKPPPGAEENATAENVEYGDPPEVEGPNFAELLPTADQVLQHTASSSKAKNIPIPIKNDGSFLEMFKKLQEETKKVEEIEKKPEIKKPLPFIGKRRGGRVLKTGVVKKAKAIDEQTVDNTPKDAWSLYMQEVKKYRETSCEEERKTRPLVKNMPEQIKSQADIKTAPFDPRFPNTNQTRYCYQSYLDFHRCQKVRGEQYDACKYFKRVYKSLCPNEWVDKWDTQLSEGTFPGRI